LFTSYVHYTRFRDLLDAPPPCLGHRPQPNPTACRWTQMVPVSRNCTNNNIKLLFTFFEDTNPFARNVSSRAFVHCCLLAPLVLGRETSDTGGDDLELRLPPPPPPPPPLPVCAADTNTQCADRTIATDECIFRTGCLSHRPADYSTTVIRFAMSHLIAKASDLCLNGRATRM